MKPYWKAISNRYWSIPPPLRPGDIEQALYQSQLDLYVPSMTSPAVLVLGATPLFHGFDWPAGSRLLAADRSADMLRELWPGRQDQTLQSDWCSLQLPDESQDLILTDGGLSFFDFSGDSRDFADTVGRLLKPQGLLISRTFILDPLSDSDDKLVTAITNRGISNDSELKVALWNLVAVENAGKVALAKTAVRFDSILHSFPSLASDCPWLNAAKESIDAYRDMTECYYLNSVKQISRSFHKAGLELRTEITPQCNLSGNIRMLVFQKS
ncbi:MAG: methyltransferase domain-containing protein [Gammaproteobacteria bacterium]